MNIYKKQIEIETKNQIDFIDITDEIKEAIKESKIKDGQVLIFSPHTTASILINHNEPMLLQDFSRILYRLAPIDDRYNHDLFELSKKNLSDGRSNGHSHCKNIILGCSESLILAEGKIILGKRQSIFFVELDGGRKRDYFVQVSGE